MNDPSSTLIILLGPTGIGKTQMAIRLASRYKAEIISCDARQFYRELNIGVARPSPQELGKIPHHLIGFLSVHQTYNVSLFEKDVLALCSRLFERRPVVFMTGGSGLYIHAVTHGIDTLPDPDVSLREMLKNELMASGLPALHQRLKELDPVYFSEVDRNNPSRILRALEVCMATGLPYSALRKNEPRQRPFRIVKIGLKMDREQLYGRINNRVDEMLKAGLVDEARALYPYRHLSALKTVGYTELFRYFEGNCSLEEAVRHIKTHSRRYAKRQLTWFAKDPDIRWFRPDQSGLIKKYMEDDIRPALPEGKAGCYGSSIPVR